MQLSLNNFSVPKLGNTEDENDDAFWPPEKYEIVTNNFSMALADGATEGAYSRQWAQCLAKAVCEAGDSEILTNINRILGVWATQKNLLIQSKRSSQDNLQWWEDEIIHAPSFSTILQLRLTKCKDHFGEWVANAIGDSCLFQIRDDRLINSFPILDSDQFNNRPYLVSTDISANGELSSFEKHCNGNWEKDDYFLLMTDALACWFLQSCEASAKPWISLRDLWLPDHEESFVNVVRELREQREIKNDDTTLMILRIEF